jgi:hypothetical protein
MGACAWGATMSLKALGRALYSSDLAPDPDHVCDIDRITAIGHARPIGATLLKLRLGATIDANALVRKATMHLAKRNRKMPPDDARKLAAWAVHEFINGTCRDCGGTGIRILDRNVQKPCHVCHASGVRRFSDTERERRTGLPPNLRNSRALLELADWFQRQFGGATRDIHRVMQ